MKRLENVIKNISITLDKIAGAFIVLVMILVVSNVILRTIFNSPIKGTYELVGYFTAIAVGLGLAYCAFQNGHIGVEFIMNHFPQKVQKGVDTIIHVVSLCLWSTASWFLVQYANEMMVKGLVTATSEIPVFPFIYAIAFGFSIFALVNLYKVVVLVKEMVIEPVRNKLMKRIMGADRIREEVI